MVADCLRAGRHAAAAAEANRAQIGSGQALNVTAAALERRHELSPDAKARLLEACVLAITDDETIRLPEAAVVRLVASELDLPLPPILENPANRGQTTILATHS